MNGPNGSGASVFPLKISNRWPFVVVVVVVVAVAAVAFVINGQIKKKKNPVPIDPVERIPKRIPKESLPSSIWRASWVLISAKTPVNYSRSR